MTKLIYLYIISVGIVFGSTFYTQCQILQQTNELVVPDYLEQLNLCDRCW